MTKRAWDMFSWMVCGKHARVQARSSSLSRSVLVDRIEGEHKEA